MAVTLPAGARIKTTPASKRRVAVQKTGMVPMDKHPETTMQKALFSYLKHPWTLAQYPEFRWIHSSLNGVKMSRTQAMIAAASGMTAGIHDLFFPLASGGYCGLYIELKARKNSMTKEQKAFRDFVVGQGYLAMEVKDDWLLAKHIIRDYYAGQYVRGESHAQ